MQVGGLNVPTEGAMAVTLNAEIVLIWASGEKTVTAKDVKLKPGTKVDLGLTKMEIVELPENWRRNDRQGPGRRTASPRWSAIRRRWSTR